MRLNDVTFISLSVLYTLSTFSVVSKAFELFSDPLVYLADSIILAAPGRVSYMLETFYYPFLSLIVASGAIYWTNSRVLIDV